MTLKTLPTQAELRAQVLEIVERNKTGSAVVALYTLAIAREIEQAFQITVDPHDSSRWSTAEDVIRYVECKVTFTMDLGERVARPAPRVQPTPTQALIGRAADWIENAFLGNEYEAHPNDRDRIKQSRTSRDALVAELRSAAGE